MKKACFEHSDLLTVNDLNYSTNPIKGSTALQKRIDIKRGRRSTGRSMDHRGGANPSRMAAKNPEGRAETRKNGDGIHPVASKPTSLTPKTTVTPTPVLTRAQPARNLLENGPGSQGHKFDYEPFNCNNFSIRYWSWYYRGCWHQTCPPMDPR